MRVALSAPAVKRMFDEATLEDVVRSVDFVYNENALRRELRALVANLAVTW